ncbi:MAG: 2-C-methyl-D-erythritol 4-phosphate cytidylyltransferase [Bdellovibrionales bacterium]|nr:2-C-methyl-D-erythritol 4-phosphate cytidylyltransferase [Bdellovibrionales bacterium]
MTNLRNIYGIVVAAGQGTRLGFDMPKALVKIRDGEEQTILGLALSQLCKTPGVTFSKFFVTYPDGYLGQFESVLEDAASLVLGGAASLVLGGAASLVLGGAASLVLGGATRQESVRLALQAIGELKPKPRDLVLIHDAARCFVDPETVRAVIDCAAATGAATLGVPQTDSLKVVNSVDLRVERSVSREELWRVQTPQVFEFQHIIRAHAEYQGPATDDASMVEPFHSVQMVMGSEQNFKVTTSWDLELLRCLV